MTRQSRSETKLQDRLEELKAFKKKHGHCDLWNYRHSHRALYKWCKAQRVNQQRGLLLLRRRRLLDKIGFEWSLQEFRWNKRFEQLKAFKQRYGHCWVPKDWKEDPQFSRWASTCRHRPDRLSENRKRKLASLGFEWKRRSDTGITFQKWLETLKAFKKKFGHCRVTGLLHEYRSLAHWCRTIRVRERCGKGIPVERKRLLDEIGFVWIPSENRWQRRYEELRAHWQKFGHCRIKPANREQIKLSRWVIIQRAQRRKRQLSSKQIRLLNKLGFEWNPQKTTTAFQKRLEELRAFKKRFGHCLVTRARPEYRSLANWYRTFRSQVLHGRQLSAEQKRQLDEVGFVWIPSEGRWQRRYEELRAHWQKFGHCRIKPANREQIKLSRWVIIQRAQRRKRQLSSERIRLLNKLDFEWRSSKSGPTGFPDKP